jgi:uncharacterized protein (TIGR02391 family)
MAIDLSRFERIARRAYRFTEAAPASVSADHPFDLRNIHSDLPADVRDLFDSGHYPQATFEAFKFVDEEMQRISGSTQHGTALMHSVLGGSPPTVQVNAWRNKTDRDEQEGYKFLFAGSMLGIRNPRGHKTGLVDDPDTCLDHLSLASMLLRKLDDAGLR